MCKYILIVIAILICFTLIGNAIACSVIYNPNSVECNYIVYGGITLMIVGALIILLYYLMKQIMRKQRQRRQEYSPRIVVFEKDDYPMQRNPMRSKSRNIIT